jgi:hypothetical protein
MSLESVLFMLLGAALVAIGVLAAALADRVRGLRISREPSQRPAPRKATPAPIDLTPIEVVEPEPYRTPAERVLMSKDVIAALVAAGYKRSAAATAVDACTSAERATIEDWTRAALRRVGGGAS